MLNCELLVQSSGNGVPRKTDPEPEPVPKPVAADPSGIELGVSVGMAALHLCF